MSPSEPIARLLTPEQIDPLLCQRAAWRDGFADEYPFSSHWFEVDGHVQHFITEGQGPVLLMVHGNPTWSFAWRRLVKDLSRDHRVIAIDHLGCGFSEKPQDRNVYTLNGHIQRLAALVQLLDLQQITLFCHDWGGAIGMGCAGRLADRFARFVLMNTGAFHSQAIPLRIALCRIPLLGTIGDRGLNLFARAALSMAVEKPLSSAARAGFIAPYDSWANRIAVHEFVQDIPLNASHRSYATLTGVEQSLEKFRDHPVQLVWGMQDWCFTPKDFLSEFRRRFPGASTLELTAAGHYVFEDAPDELLSQVRRFLANHLLAQASNKR
ncbi:MAG TPA: alpha/beta fold hydrolase [Planctomycetaceae bacterium]|nr:alpha/beta fold hydrolase [Planctomycetaceae bacterium]